tara:strand:- start:290 stop:847 length:558 start_codon:yes stop_codon:yes gene_type:complete
MGRPQPPLNALRAFEAAGRHLSFTKAAAELNVTPAAISHQVKALEGTHPLRQPEDLRHHTLLHIDWTEAEATWRMWLLAAGLHDIDPARGPRFSMESMAIQSAVDGHGVALVGELLVADHLAAGRLVRPFDPGLSTPLTFAFYLLSAKDRADTPKIAAFRDWLMEEGRAVSGTTASQPDTSSSRT